MNFATREAKRHNVLQAWNVRKIVNKASEHVHATRLATN